MVLGQDAGMHIRAVAFDVNGTLVKILTEDGSEDIFRAAAHLLTYQGIDMCQARSGLAGGSGSGASGLRDAGLGGDRRRAGGWPGPRPQRERRARQ